MYYYYMVECNFGASHVYMFSYMDVRCEGWVRGSAEDSTRAWSPKTFANLIKRVFCLLELVCKLKYLSFWPNGVG